MTREKIQSFTLRISHANKTEMMAILYDIGIEYLNDAINSLSANDNSDFAEDIHKFRGVLRELMNSVNTGDGVGRTFLSLYIFAGKEVTNAFINKDQAPLNRLIDMFTEMSDCYKEAAKKDTSGPVMEHAETVYSGFTYNRNSMTENVNSADISRGFLV